jgi:hypothetical protein
MRRVLISSFCAGVAVAGLLAAMVLTTDRALPAHFPRGTEACFGRVYDTAFLAAHPNHRFTELYVLREFVQGGSRGDARERAMQISADRASTDDLSLTVMARLRDKPGAYDRGVTCSSDGPLGATCSADCEGALFSIRPDGRGLALDRGDKISFVNFTDGGGRLRLQRDAADYRLDPMPIETCLAAYDHAAGADHAGTATPVPSVAGE